MPDSSASADRRANYDRAADCFDAPACAFWHVIGRQTVDLVAPSAGDRILDLCCGTGASALEAAKRVGPTGHVLGVDISEGMLSRARSNAAATGLDSIEWRRGDFRELVLEPESFGAVICVFGIFFAEDLIATIREFNDLVRPGGTLAITIWDEDPWEPIRSAWNQILESIRPDLLPEPSVSDRIGHHDVFRELMTEALGAHATVVRRRHTQSLESPSDWWTVLHGSGQRTKIEGLAPAEAKIARERIESWIVGHQVSSFTTNSLVGLARKPH